MSTDGGGDGCVHCGKPMKGPVQLTCKHDLCNKCEDEIKKLGNDAGAQEFHCPECNKGVEHQAKKRGGQKKDEVDMIERRTQYYQKKSEIIKNLEELERENENLEDFMRKLNVLGEKVKVNASQLRNDVTRECDALILIIERRRRVMMSKVDAAQQEKLRKLQAQIRTCQRAKSKGHAVIIRTNRDLERLPQVTLLSKADSINGSINDARESHPEMTPEVNEKMRYAVDFSKAKDHLEELDLEDVEGDEDENKGHWSNIADENKEAEDEKAGWSGLAEENKDGENEDEKKEEEEKGGWSGLAEENS